MQIPSNILRSAVFLCEKQIIDGKENFVPRGTGFFVGVPSEMDKNAVHIYLVTAFHNLEKINLDDLSMRVNGRDGGRIDVQQVGARWYTHPSNSNIDVAVFLNLPVDHGHTYIPLDMFVTPENVKNEDVRVGDEAFIIGLFTQHHGKFANLPIVRIGNIAMIPGEMEKVAVKWHDAELDAYLIEARSIGGLSGSPVFFSQDIYSQQKGVEKVELRKEINIYLGGLVHGHFEVDSSKIDSAKEDAVNVNNRVNMGIAIVIPANKILEVLMQDELKELRAEIDKRMASANTAPSK